MAEQEQFIGICTLPEAQRMPIVVSIRIEPSEFLIKKKEFCEKLKAPDCKGCRVVNARNELVISFMDL